MLANKNLPNVITIARMIGTAVLLFLRPLSPLFLVVYTLTGVSDALDGFLARKYGTASELGARLDSIADMLFYLVSLVKVAPILWEKMPRAIWFAVGAVLLVRLSSYVVCAVKYHHFASLHTYLNKATGLMVFGVVYVLSTSAIVPYGWIVCVIGMLSSLEELVEHITSKKE